MSNAEELKSLGSEKTDYKFEPDAGILESFQNQHPENTYLIPFVQERDEFTSLCPKTKQPDHAKMEIIYVPNELCVESKSLKPYLFSYRNHGEFHEDVCNKIANDLFALLKPRYLRVYGDFAPRGGLAIKPVIEKWGEAGADAYAIERMVAGWDLRNGKK